MEDWVFVDTCIWASFFTKPSSPEKRNVDGLIDTDRVALIGPILAGVLLGFKRKDQADWVGSRMSLANYADLSPAEWRSAADLGRELAKKSHKLPLTDVVLATVAIRLSASVYTTDPHFDVIPELRRYEPRYCFRI